MSSVCSGREAWGEYVRAGWPCGMSIHNLMPRRECSRDPLVACIRDARTSTKRLVGSTPNIGMCHDVGV